MRRMNEFQIERFESAVNIRYTPQMICAKSQNKEEDADACQGDSGGPLIRQVKKFSNKNLLCF